MCQYDAGQCQLVVLSAIPVCMVGRVLCGSVGHVSKLKTHVTVRLSLLPCLVDFSRRMAKPTKCVLAPYVYVLTMPT